MQVPCALAVWLILAQAAYGNGETVLRARPCLVAPYMQLRGQGTGDDTWVAAIRSQTTRERELVRSQPTRTSECGDLMRAGSFCSLSSLLLRGGGETLSEISDLSSEAFDFYATAEAQALGHNFSRAESIAYLDKRRFDRRVRREDKCVRRISEGLSPQARADLGKAIRWAPALERQQKEQERERREAVEATECVDESDTHAQTHQNEDHGGESNDTESSDGKVYIDGIEDVVAMARNGELKRLNLAKPVEKEVHAALLAYSMRRPGPVHPQSRFAEAIAAVEQELELSSTKVAELESRLDREIKAGRDVQEDLQTICLNHDIEDFISSSELEEGEEIDGSLINSDGGVQRQGSEAAGEPVTSTTAANRASARGSEGGKAASPRKNESKDEPTKSERDVVPKVLLVPEGKPAGMRDEDCRLGGPCYNYTAKQVDEMQGCTHVTVDANVSPHFMKIRHPLAEACEWDLSDTAQFQSFFRLLGEGHDVVEVLLSKGTPPPQVQEAVRKFREHDPEQEWLANATRLMSTRTLLSVWRERLCLAEVLLPDMYARRDGRANWSLADIDMRAAVAYPKRLLNSPVYNYTEHDTSWRHTIDAWKFDPPPDYAPYALGSYRGSRPIPCGDDDCW